MTEAKPEQVEERRRAKSLALKVLAVSAVLIVVLVLAFGAFVVILVIEGSRGVVQVVENRERFVELARHTIQQQNDEGLLNLPAHGTRAESFGVSYVHAGPSVRQPFTLEPFAIQWPPVYYDAQMDVVLSVAYLDGRVDTLGFDHRNTPQLTDWLTGNAWPSLETSLGQEAQIPPPEDDDLGREAQRRPSDDD